MNCRRRLKPPPNLSKDPLTLQTLPHSLILTPHSLILTTDYCQHLASSLRAQLLTRLSRFKLQGPLTLILLTPYYPQRCCGDASGEDILPNYARTEAIPFPENRHHSQIAKGSGSQCLPRSMLGEFQDPSRAVCTS